MVQGWYFEFGGESIFVTTFAPCYKSDSSRYCFLEDNGDPSSCFILLQPELSFAKKNIGEETPDTNWDDPQTIRDKIRCEFKKHGRSYPHIMFSSG
jgi:hypothetical protein